MTTATHALTPRSTNDEVPYTLYPYAGLEALRKRIGMDLRAMAVYLGVSDKTYERRRHQGTLNPGESLKAEMLELALADAVRVFGDEGPAREWLREPILALGDHSPIEHLTSVRGYQEVRDTLLQLQHGIF